MRNAPVLDVFPLRDEHVLMVRLETWEWDQSIGLCVALICGSHRLETRQSGVGNLEGKLVLRLAPTGSWEDADRTLQAIEAHGGAISAEVP